MGRSLAWLLWVHDEKLETAFPNPPKITSGKIVAQSNGVAVA